MRKKKGASKKKVYSIGYEGKTIEVFTEMLADNGIKLLVDVRDRAFSRKRGFSKDALSAELTREGIGYIHLPRLGTDLESRKNYKTHGSFERLITEYEQRFQAGYDDFTILKTCAEKNVVAVMCFEDDKSKCHRSRILDELEKEGMEVQEVWNGQKNACSSRSKRTLKEAQSMENRSA